MKLLVLILMIITPIAIQAQDKEDLIGRWNLVIHYDDNELPSWLEVVKSGTSTLTGRFVYASGSARPIAEVEFEKGQFRFSIPPQWEPGSLDMVFSGHLTDSGIEGTMIFTDGRSHHFTGVRAPNMLDADIPKWGKPIDLFNGKDLTGWHADGENQWTVKSGILTNPESGANLISDQKFSDFKLQMEFRYPKGSNSGLYLRGRYEVQIIDSYGDDPSSVLFGGVYGFLTPNQMAAKPAGEWQSYDITLIGRRVTIIANGIPIIQDQIIPGMTGGAIDNREEDPGPILLQGDHGPVEIRKLTITPATGM